MFDWLKPVVDWLDKPWKALALAALSLLAGLMWAAWIERQILVDYIRSQVSSLHLDLEAAQDSLPTLLRYADFVVLWEVDPARNYQKVIAAFGGDDEQRAEVLGSEHPYVSDIVRPGLIAREIEGETICVSHDHYLTLPFTYVCAQKIPTYLPGVIGIVHILWTEKPDEVTENQAIVVMRFVTEKLAVW